MLNVTDGAPALSAVLDRAAGGWRGVIYTPADVRLLQMIRRDGVPRRVALAVGGKSV